MVFVNKSSLIIGITLAIVFLPSSSLPLGYAIEFLPIWDKDSYHVGEAAKITVQDSSKNFLSGAKDEIYTTIKSDSFTEGVQLRLIETENNSSVFAGTIRFTSDINSEDSLLVQENDSVYAIYNGFIQSAKIDSRYVGPSVSPILVSTDKTTYKLGEVIIVSGSVSGGNPGFPVNFSIMNPNGKIIINDLIELSSVLRFSTEIKTEEHSWEDSGNYKIQVWHGSETTKAEAVFSYSTSFDLEERTSSIKIFDSPYYIKYSITSEKISLIKPVVDSKSLIFSIDSDISGHLTVELPRHLIDAQTLFGEDDSFVVLDDGRKSEFVEKASSNERTLTIPYTHKTKTIEIQGTFLNIDPLSQPLQSDESVEIPKWIRNNAEWWSKDLIEEKDFLSGIQYLINQGIMKIPTHTGMASEPSLPFIPNWIKDTTGWWASGKVTDQDFLSGIQYLIERGIIRV